MTKGKTILIEKKKKKTSKGNTSKYYRPIICPTAQIRLKIYYSLISCELSAEEQKDAESGAEDVIYIDQL